MTENTPAINSPNPIQPTPWSEWRATEHGVMVRTRIGELSQEMTEVFRHEGHPTLTEAFTDAKRITFIGPDDRRIIDSLSVFFTDGRNYTLAMSAFDLYGSNLWLEVSRVDYFESIGRADLSFVDSVGRTIRPYVDWVYNKDLLKELRIKGEGDSALERAKGSIRLRFLPEGVISRWSTGGPTEDEIDAELRYMTEHIPILEENTETRVELTETRWERSYTLYGEEIKAKGKIVTAGRDGDIVTVSCTGEGGQALWEAGFPLKVPQEQIIAILNNLEADFSEIRQLAPVSFRKSSAI